MLRLTGKAVGVVFLVVGAAHLLLLYLSSALAYSDLVGVPGAERSLGTAGNVTAVALFLAIGAQFLVAWILKPSGRADSMSEGDSGASFLTESTRPELWERYSALVLLSSILTLILFSGLFYVARRTDYLPRLLRLLGGA